MTDRDDHPKVPGNAFCDGADRTLPSDPGETFTALSAAQWRKRFDVSEGKELSDYGKLHPLGLGGMGVVFEAEDPGLKRPIALKLLRPQYRGKEASIERFIREAQITAQIDHPNIVSVHRFGFFDDAGAYFTMKRVQGKTLKTLLAEIAGGDTALRRQFSLRRLVQLFIAVCNGIAAAHERGFLHCDLKPANVMVGKFGQILVMDWGIAREIGASAAAPYRLEGTPVFLAPELVTGKIPAPDRQTDVYSLGAILWCILTKRESPFDPELEQEKLMGLIAVGDFPRPSRCAGKLENIPVELEAIVLKAMNRDRQKRYADVSALLVDLHSYLDGFPVTAYSPNVFYRMLKLIRRRPLIPVTLLAALLTAGIFSGVLRTMEYFDQRTVAIVANSDFYRLSEHLQQLSHQFQKLRSNEDKLPEPVLEEQKKPLLAQLHNLSGDLFDAFNVISRLPAERQRAFLRDSGGEALYRLLLLQREFDSPEQTVGTVERFRRRHPELYRDVRKLSPRLNGLIRLIQTRKGCLKIVGDPAWRCTVSQPGKPEIFTAVPNGAPLELPAGEYSVNFSHPTKPAVTQNKVRVLPGPMVQCCTPGSEENQD